MKVSRSYQFLSIPEFEKEYKTKISKFTHGELCIEEITDTNGQRLKGVVMADADQPFRRVTLETVSGFNLQRSLGTPGDMLRPNQHAEFLSHLQKQEQGQLGKAWKDPLTAAQLEKMLEAVGGKGQADAAAPSAAESTGQQHHLLLEARLAKRPLESSMQMVPQSLSTRSVLTSQS